MFSRRRRGRWIVHPDAPPAELGGALPTFGSHEQLVEETEEIAVAERTLKLRIYTAEEFWRWEIVQRPDGRVLAAGASVDHAGALSNGLRIWTSLAREVTWAPAEN